MAAEADRARLQVLKAWGLDAPADDVRLCVSELASNALLHGTKRGHGFLVRLDADEDFVRLEVHDSHDRRGGCEPQPAIQHPADTDTTGRGLRIVDILADGWGVEDREPLGKIVWSRFKAGFPGPSNAPGWTPISRRSPPGSPPVSKLLPSSSPTCCPSDRASSAQSPR
ncbi:ATP-binding protein [Streptomyces sp. MS1.AVA.3]|uniref:ATP-binding protein n=1 Tax=Streptomyces decoyicus TaxID=249567 RepID=UPI0030BA49AC